MRKKLEHELSEALKNIAYKIFKPPYSERNTEIVTRHLGLDGREKISAVKLSKHNPDSPYQVSPQLITSLAKKVRLEAQQTVQVIPRLKEAIKAIIVLAPATCADMEAHLANVGIVKKGTLINIVYSAIKIFGYGDLPQKTVRKFELISFVSEKGKRMLLDEGTRDLPFVAQAIAVKKVSLNGAACIVDIVTQSRQVLLLQEKFINLSAPDLKKTLESEKYIVFGKDSSGKKLHYLDRGSIKKLLKVFSGRAPRKKTLQQLNVLMPIVCRPHNKVKGAHFNRISSAVEEREYLTIVIEEITHRPSFEWLGKPYNWFYIKDVSGNKLVTRLERILSVYKTVKMENVMIGLQRSYREHGVLPPESIIRQIVKSEKIGTLERDTLHSTGTLDPEKCYEQKKSELELVKALIAQDQESHFIDLAAEFMDVSKNKKESRSYYEFCNNINFSTLIYRHQRGAYRTLGTPRDSLLQQPKKPCRGQLLEAGRSS